MTVTDGEAAEADAVADDLRAQLVAATKERDDALAWVKDLQSGMYVNCVYCGHRYGPGETTPASMADALKAHVEQCPKHPMSALKAELTRLRAAITPTAENLDALYDTWKRWDAAETVDADIGASIRDMMSTVLAAIRAKAGL